MQHSILERLESRQLLTSVPTFRLDRGTLYVVGTSGADEIVITRSESLDIGNGFDRATVIAADGTVNSISTPSALGIHPTLGQRTTRSVASASVSGSATRDFPPGPYFQIVTQGGLTFVPIIAISGIRIDAGAGNDLVEFSRNVALRTTLIGGSGDDTLAGSTRSDVILGGAGDDVLFGGAESANDRIDSGSGSDVIVRYTNRPTVDALGGGLTPILRGGDTYITGRFASIEEALATRVIDDPGRGELRR